MKHVGLGDLLERLERLRAQLAAEGLFDPAAQEARCRSCRTRIGLITGKDSDAEKDVLRNAQLRWPQVRLPRRARRGAGRPHACRRCSPRSRRWMPTPRSTSSSSPAAAATSRTCSASATSAWCAPPPPRRRRSSARSATRPTGRCSTRSPTCAPPRRPMPRSASCPTCRRSWHRVQQARARIAHAGSPQLMRHEIDRIGHLRVAPGARRSRSWIVDSRAEELTRCVARGAELVDRRVERAGAPARRARGPLRALSPQRTLDRGYAIVQTRRRHDRPRAARRRRAGGHAHLTRRRRCRTARSPRRATGRGARAADRHRRVGHDERRYGRASAGRRIGRHAPARPIPGRTADPTSRTQLRGGARRARARRRRARAGRRHARGVARPLGARRGARAALRGVAARRQGASTRRAPRSTAPRLVSAAAMSRATRAAGRSSRSSAARRRRRRPPTARRGTRRTHRNQPDVPQPRSPR